MSIPVRMPVLFMGHGSPMNAVEENPFSKEWKRISSFFPIPKAIVSISAHWETAATAVTAMDKPRTIYDFYGFPRELYEVKYPAPGSPALAEEIRTLIGVEKVTPDQSWGLDHGSWSVLRRLYPKADVPVVQLSLNSQLPPESHYQLGRKIKSLRDKGVLILGSGNLVHNLHMIGWDMPGGYDWAVEFNETVKGLLSRRDDQPLVNYQNLGKSARLSVPTNEHYLPLLYCLGASDEDSIPELYNDGLVYGSISMLCALWR